MTRLKDYAILALLILALIFGLVSYHQFQEQKQLRADLALVKDALETEQKLRSADVGSLSIRLEATRKLQEAKEKRDVQTAKAIAANPVWSSERVPDDVVDALGL